MLSTANQRLRKMREEVPNAAGLVVAASVEHAALITQILATEMNQQAVLVTYKTPDAAAQIEKFRSSDAAWIIREGANKRGNSSRLTQSFHFFMFEPIFSPVNALNQPI
ncbi:hypothetical protein MXE95_20650 [Aeromonas caviae]|uniref:hypothetical protein n=1 Tax=Aeromonas caviae TaxID=648 RepID=UPI002DB866FE|nr:hypothetical protein [Aeromonas caviae]MEB5776423.1 hypothetical protein [Aeromonas caviae]MEB6651650.1 hypothetical protein [Aeromonas caviae]